ncbi:hypothetical protein IGK74_002402 [Enterococcus sp. AZ150]|uniref:phage tail spike protein n=1 Tax=Enterococcus sp. AZ150 TaxID=2774866 RepID=UPI003F28B0BC
MIELPRITVTDANSNFLTFIDNTVEKALHYSSAKLHTYLTGTASTLDITITKTADDASLIREGCKLFFVYNETQYAVNVMRVEEDEYTLSITALALSLELNNTEVDAYKAPKQMAIEEYIKLFDTEDSLTIGVNELDYRRTLEWEGSSSLLARLLSLATKFDAELQFTTKVDNSFNTTATVVDIYKKNDDNHQGIGQYHPEIKLSYGQNVKRIKRTVDITELQTSIRPIGKDGLTLIGKNYEEYNKNHEVEFFSFKETGWIYAPLVRDRFPSTTTGKNPNDRYMGATWEYDTDKQDTLYGQALARLKKISEPTVTYEVEGYFDLKLGDTIRIYDDKFNPPLMLEARVSEQEIDFTNPENNKTTFTNFDVLENEVADSLLNRVNTLLEQNKTYNCSIVTDNGNTFKNGEGRTTLYPRILDGLRDITKNCQCIWYKDGIELGIYATLTVNASDVESTALYSFTASKLDNEQSIGISEITLMNVEDGKKGSEGVPGKDGIGVVSTAVAYALSASGTTNPSNGWTANVPTLVKGQYLWTKTTWTYTDNRNETGYSVAYIAKDGNKGDDGIAGKDGVGLTSTTINYAASISGTTKPTSGWSTTIPSVAAGSYLWTRTVWTYTDGTNEIGYSISMMGKSGDDGIAGKDGVGMKSTTVTYAASTSGTTAPTSGYTTTVPNVAKGSYLWTKTLWTYTDNSTETGYSVAYMGTNGNNGTNGVAGKDGVGITSTTITYASSTSGTSAPTSGYTTSVPSVVEGSFLWTKTVWTYTDGTNETGYSVAKQGAKGSTGASGEKGADGKGVKSTDITYAASTSGTTAPTNGYTSSVPSVAAGSFLWTKSVMTYTDNSTSIFYSVGKMGSNGATGPTGAKGATGATGPKGDSTGIISAASAPTTDLYVGKLYLNTTNGITYRYTGSKWEIWAIKAEMINATSLAAISADLGEVKAGKMSSQSTQSGSVQFDLNNQLFNMEKKKNSDTYKVTLQDAKMTSYLDSIYSPDIETGELEGATLTMTGANRTNGTRFESTALTPYGITNKKQLAGVTNTRDIKFNDNGMELRAGTENKGTNLNSGIDIFGTNTYIDFHNSVSDTQDYGSRTWYKANGDFEIVNELGNDLLLESKKGYIQLKSSKSIVTRSQSVEVRNAANTAYVPIYASNISNASSLDWKYNVKKMRPTLKKFKKLQLKEYRQVSPAGQYQMGIIIEENIDMPFVDNESKTVDLYAYITFIAKALQEEVEARENLEERIAQLETKLETLGK